MRVFIGVCAFVHWLALPHTNSDFLQRQYERYLGLMFSGGKGVNARLGFFAGQA
jgi:hypothetical protein